MNRFSKNNIEKIKDMFNKKTDRNLSVFELFLFYY
jgi:hypothetical protein